MIQTTWSDHTRSLHRDAWWYANGRKDAGDTIEPWKFAEAYADLAHRFEHGDTTFRPSIQDAYRQVTP